MVGKRVVPVGGEARARLVSATGGGNRINFQDSLFSQSPMFEQHNELRLKLCLGSKDFQDGTFKFIAIFKSKLKFRRYSFDFMAKSNQKWLSGCAFEILSKPAHIFRHIKVDFSHDCSPTTCTKDSWYPRYVPRALNSHD